MHEDTVHQDNIIVLTHVPDLNTAKQIAQALVSAKLAACVNIAEASQSVYEWQGKVHCETEFALSIKTNQAAYQQVETLILDMHPYELPDIISLSIDSGYAPYLQWVNQQVARET